MVTGTGIETISVIYDWKIISLWNSYVIDMCTETRGYTVYAILVFIQWLLRRKRTERVYSWLVRSHYVWFYIQVRYRGDSSGMIFMNGSWYLRIQDMHELLKFVCRKTIADMNSLSCTTSDYIERRVCICHVVNEVLNYWDSNFTDEIIFKGRWIVTSWILP